MSTPDTQGQPEAGAPEPEIRVPEVSVDILARLHGSVPLIDVRMPDEYEEAHVPGAVLIPLPELADRLGEVPSGDGVYVICRSGGRSFKACELLISKGIDATNVAGGTLAWIEGGHDVATGAEPG